MDKQTAQQIIHNFRVNSDAKRDCDYWKALDTIHDTPANSPLHHSQRFSHNEDCPEKR